MSDCTHNDSECLSWPRPSDTRGPPDTRYLRDKSVTDQNGSDSPQCSRLCLPGVLVVHGILEVNLREGQRGQNMTQKQESGDGHQRRDAGEKVRHNNTGAWHEPRPMVKQGGETWGQDGERELACTGVQVLVLGGMILYSLQTPLLFHFL